MRLRDKSLISSLWISINRYIRDLIFFAKNFITQFFKVFNFIIIDAYKYYAIISK